MRPFFAIYILNCSTKFLKRPYLISFCDTILSAEQNFITNMSFLKPQNQSWFTKMNKLQSSFDDIL